MKKTSYKGKTNSKSNAKSGSRNSGRNRTKYKDQNECGSIDKLDRKDSSNDPMWYAADEALLRDAASIPFSWATGTETDIYVELSRNLASDQKGRNSGVSYIVPGVCVLKLMPWFGYSETQIDPLNVAATAMYSFVRHANSGSKNYDAPDLMLYVMSMTQIYSYINFLQRAYGIAQLYVQRNRYIPETLLKAMNIDPLDVQEHLSDFRYSINVLINKVSSLAVPSEFTLFNRQAFLYQNVYTEGTSIKDQLYMYVPDGFWKFSLNSSNQSGQLIYIPFTPSAVRVGTGNGDKFKVDDLIKYGNELLNAVMLNEDMNIMSGDILKAYGDARIMKVSSLPPEYVIAPIFDIAVLEQMHNAVAYHEIWSPQVQNYTLGSGYSVNLPTISQNVSTNAIVCKPTVMFIAGQNIQVSGSGGNPNVFFRPSLVQNEAYPNYIAMDYYRASIRNAILTTTTAEVDPKLIMESTRLIAVPSQVITAIPSVRDESGLSLWCGTEVCQSIEYWVGSVNNGDWSASPFILSSTSATSNQSTDTQSKLYNTDFSKFTPVTSLPALAAREAFKFAPMHEIVQYAYASATLAVADYGTLMCAFDNYAILTHEVVRKLHETALLNQLHVNSIARLG